MRRPPPGPATARSSRLAVPTALGVLVLVALLLRLPLMDDSFFGDELSTYFVVRDHGPREVVELVRSDQEQTPPLFFVLAWFADLLGHDSSLMRLPSLLAGLALVPVVYALGLRTAGRGAGLLGACLVALSPFLVFYATEARSYGVALLLATLSTLALVTALQTRERRWWAVYALASCLALYTHYTTVFVLAAQGGWALVACREQWRPLVAANVAAGLAFAPWLPEYRADGDTPVARIIEALHPFTLANVRADLQQLFAGVPFEPVSALPGRPVALALLAGLLAAAVGAGLRHREDADRNPDRWWSLLLVVALAAPVLEAIVSLAGSSIFSTRNLITAVPGALLLASAVALHARGRWRLAAAGLLVGAYAAGAVQLLDAEHQRPDSDAPVAWVADHGRPGDPLVQATVALNAPGLLQSVEVALDDQRVDAFPVVRLGAPAAEDDRVRRSLGGPGQFAPIALPEPEALAAETRRLARGGRIHLIAPGHTDEGLRALPPDNPLSRYLTALGDEWRVATARTYPGLVPTALLELRRRPA